MASSQELGWLGSSDAPSRHRWRSTFNWRSLLLCMGLSDFGWSNPEAMMLEDYTIPAGLFPSLERRDLEGWSLYKTMEQQYGVALNRARQRLEPVVSTEYEAKLLGILPGTPLMLERRLSYDLQDVAVEHGTGLYRGERFRFTADIAPMDRGLPPRR